MAYQKKLFFFIILSFFNPAQAVKKTTKQINRLPLSSLPIKKRNQKKEAKIVPMLAVIVEPLQAIVIDVIESSIVPTIIEGELFINKKHNGKEYVQKANAEQTLKMRRVDCQARKEANELANKTFKLQLSFPALSSNNDSEESLTEEELSADLYSYQEEESSADLYSYQENESAVDLYNHQEDSSLNLLHYKEESSDLFFTYWYYNLRSFTNNL